MATSGTYSFTMNRDGIIGAALQLVGAFGPQDTIPSTDITTCAVFLNMLAKFLAVQSGLFLWCVMDVPVPMITAEGTYNLSQLTGMTLPLRILDAYLRDSTGNDVSIKVVSRYDYDTLGQKTSQSVPNQIMYDPQLTGGIITTYNVASDSTHTLHLVIQRQIQDFNFSTDNPDFPQEAYLMLVYGLADLIGLVYRCPIADREEISIKAKSYHDAYVDSNQEQVSVYLTPSERTR